LRIAVPLLTEADQAIDRLEVDAIAVGKVKRLKPANQPPTSSALPSGPAPTVYDVPFIQDLTPGEPFGLLPIAFPAIPLEGAGCESLPPPARLVGFWRERRHHLRFVLREELHDRLGLLGATDYEIVASGFNPEPSITRTLQKS
jgi:hypothetical protein